jgi:hypothetical protein
MSSRLRCFGGSVGRQVACYLGLGLLPLFAQVQVIPQVADGGGWSTTIVLSNRTSATQSVNLRFNRSTSNGATEPWTPPFVDNPSLTSLSLPAGASLFLRTQGTAGQVTQGWGEVDGGSGVVGYAIFTSKNGNSPAQDATAPAVLAASRILVPFDNTTGLLSAIAVVNPGASPILIQANIRTTDGLTISGTLPLLPAKGQSTFVMPTQFAGTAGKRGLAEFFVQTGSFSMISLRFNPDSAFTSSPVYFQSGQPIVGAPTTGGPGGSPQTLVIPQVADGGGWSTTIVLTNTTTSNLTGALNFRVAGAGGATAGWNLPFRDNANTSNLSIPAGSTLFLQTQGNASTVSQGWAELTADAGVVGYAIFTSRNPGRPAQDGTATAVSSSSRLLIPFDNTSDLVTAVALVNPGNNSQTVSVNIRTSDGTTSTDGSINLPSRGQIAVAMPSQFPATAGKRGLAEFHVSSGAIALVALRFNPSGAFASAPAYFESGTPIIAPGGGSGGGGGGGGGGTGGGGEVSDNTKPTQQEIESWISRGGYSLGSLTLSRSTTYSTTEIPGSSSTVTKTDNFSAQFQRFGGADFSKFMRGEVVSGFPDLTPKIGSCLVYTLNPTLVRFPNLTSTGLDAGPQITSNGPNGNQAALRQSVPMFGFAYDAANIPNTYLASGRYTLTGPGGANVGGFTGNLNVAQEFVVTSNPDDFKLITRANGASVRWTGGEPNTLVTISGTSTVIDLGSFSAQITTFTCWQNNSAGQFTVPASVLTQLPATPSVGGFVLGSRGTFTVDSDGSGARFATPSGLDMLIANNSWNWNYTPVYQ